jgi:hypothetical protein
MNVIHKAILSSVLLASINCYSCIKLSVEDFHGSKLEIYKYNNIELTKNFKIPLKDSLWSCSLDANADNSAHRISCRMNKDKDIQVVSEPTYQGASGGLNLMNQKSLKKKAVTHRIKVSNFCTTSTKEK